MNFIHVACESEIENKYKADIFLREFDPVCFLLK